MPLPQGFIPDQSQINSSINPPSGFVMDYQNQSTQQDSPSFGVQAQKFLLGGTGNEPIGNALMANVKDIPRQAGLASRAVIQGMGNSVDLLTSPFRAGLNSMGANIPGNTGQIISNTLGLPSPQTPSERIFGDIESLVSGSAVPIGLAAKAADITSGATQGVMRALSTRPDLQMASAVGAGAAGGITRESGGGPLPQFMASLAGGIGAPLGISAGQAALSAGKSLANRFMVQSPQIQGIDNLINSAVSSNGISIGDIHSSVLNGLRSDIQQAQQNGTLTPDVVRRLVDYKTTGLIPTQGTLTLDPGIVTRQNNLSALGASSQDPNLQALSQIKNLNSAKLVENLNNLGASAPGDTLSAGRTVTDFLGQKDALVKSATNALYQNAEDTAGRGALMDGKSFSKYVSSELKSQYGRNWNDVVPSWLSGRIQSLSEGEPMTVTDWNTLRTSIGNDTRSATGNTKFALGFINRALENTPFINNAGEKAAQAANIARSNFKNWAQIVDNTPALQAIRDGEPPDKFVDKFIIGNSDKASVDNVNNLVQLIKTSPESMTAVKNNIVQTLKSAALGGKADELSKFSNTNYNKVLNKIGDDKLNMFLSPNEVQALKAIGRVSSYEQFQPTGSAINNSNTTPAMIANILDRIGNNFIVRKATLGLSPGIANTVNNPLRNMAASSEARGFLSLPTSAASRPANDRMFLLPPVLAPYLLQNNANE